MSLNLTDYHAALQALSTQPLRFCPGATHYLPGINGELVIVRDESPVVPSRGSGFCQVERWTRLDDPSETELLIDYSYRSNDAVVNAILRSGHNFQGLIVSVPDNRRVALAPARGSHR